MLTGHFYYIRDEYFRDFQDEKLMSNKEISQGQAHDRVLSIVLRKFLQTS